MTKGDRRKSKRQDHASAVARRAEQARLAREDQVPLPPDAQRYVADLLARRQEVADESWLADLAAMGERGLPGEAIGQVEPYVRDHLYDEQAALAYARLLRRAAAMEPAGEAERAALERFTDRSGLAEAKRGVTQFLQGHPDWDEFVKDRAVQDFRLVPGKLLSAEALSECAALIWEANVRGADLAMKGKTVKQTRGLHRGNHQPRTALMAFAEDPTTQPHMAKRAADWAEYGHYGLWQLRHPVPSPGVEGLDLASGTRRYLDFPSGKLDGVPPWSVWLGAAIPVDGIWRITGTGIMLSPDEGDAVTEALEKAVGKMISTAQGMPLAELDPPEPVPYDDPPPHGVRWQYFTPLDPMYGTGSGDILMMLAGRLLADVALRRADGPRPAKYADDPAPTASDWPDTPLRRLYGLTPREAAEADVPYRMLLESMLRKLEYQAFLALPGEDAADVPALRRALGTDTSLT
jgi:hypothetical protein